MATRPCRVCGGEGWFDGAAELKRGTTNANNECPACKGSCVEEISAEMQYGVYRLAPDRRFNGYFTTWEDALAKADEVREPKHGAEIWTITPDQQVAFVGRGGKVALREGFDPEALKATA